MAEKKDYYEILGVSKTVTDDELKRHIEKWQRNIILMQILIIKKEAEKKFKEVNEAYEVLSDPQKRRMYDQFGTADPQAGFGGAGGPFGGGNGYYSYTSSGWDDFGDLGDIFSSFFGGGFGGQRANSRRNNGPRKGEDLNFNLEITFEEAFMGVEKEVTITRQETCSTCHGTGANPGTNPVKCKACNGTGQIRQMQTTILGQIQTTRTCPECHGTGEVIQEPCDMCHGKGTVRKMPKIKVKIPAGIDDNQTVVLRGQGNPGTKGGPSGDIYITLRVKKHSIYKRDGNNVICDIPITITQATLGADIEVPMVDGSKEKYRIPEGTQTGTQFVVRGKGFKSLNSSYVGNFVFNVVVQTPKKTYKRTKGFTYRTCKNYE